MLSKHKFLPTKSLFIAAGIAACGLAAGQQPSNALDLTFSNRSGQDYVYGIEISGTELVEVGDQFTFSNLSGVTGISTTGALATRVDPVSFTADSATFEAIQDFGNVGSTFTFAELVITSTDFPGDVDWSGESNLGPFSGVVTGPATTSVPFEFSPGLGLLLSGTVFGALKLRSKFSRKEEINF